MVSLKDIAKECNVSVATVSKALNGRHDISEEKRGQICGVADRMGYLSNSSARALKTNRTYNLGVLFVDETCSGLRHEYFSAMLDSFKVEAESHGYDITFINRNVGMRQTSYLQHCLYRGLDGLVMACVNFLDPQVQELVSNGIPVVTIDHIFNNKIAVVSDNVQGMEKLTSFVLGRGHERIAFIHGEMTTVTENRLTGFYRACENYGITPRPEYIRQGLYHDSLLCAQETRALLELPERPTCIFFPDDYSAVGGLNTIREFGLEIPRDISVVGYDGINLAGILTPKLTTYCQDNVEIGRIAAERLITLIEKPRTAMLDRVIVSGHLVLGESVLDLRKNY